MDFPRMDPPALGYRQREQLQLVLTHVGAGANTRVIGRESDLWRWEVQLEGEWFIAFTGSLSEALNIQRHYEHVPHVIETAWGDPVCCN